MEIDRTVLSSKRLRLSASVLILAIYVASLMLPAVLKTDTSAAHDAGYPGYSILMIGWLGVANLQPAWIANPLLLLTLAMPARALGIATAVFAACAIGPPSSVADEVRSPMIATTLSWVTNFRTIVEVWPACD